MIVVSDTLPINNLAAIGQLGLLQQLYGNVIISTAVYQELLNAGATDPGTLAIQTLRGIRVSWRIAIS
jgi:predicted nucleic acid-binding protein